MSLLIVAAALLAAPPPDVPRAVQIIAEEGRYVMRTFTDAKPLYTYDKDQAGKSNCNGACATAWPPLAAPKDAKPIGQWTVVTRSDGTLQWAFGGKPVYTFAQDAEGVSSGDGMGGAWHLLPTTSYR